MLGINALEQHLNAEHYYSGTFLVGELSQFEWPDLLARNPKKGIPVSIREFLRNIQTNPVVIPAGISERKYRIAYGIVPARAYTRE
jgi:hypothetical protein